MIESPDIVALGAKWQVFSRSTLGVEPSEDAGGGLRERFGLIIILTRAPILKFGAPLCRRCSERFNSIGGRCCFQEYVGDADPGRARIHATNWVWITSS